MEDKETRDFYLIWGLIVFTIMFFPFLYYAYTDPDFFIKEVEEIEVVVANQTCVVHNVTTYVTQPVQTVYEPSQQQRIEYMQPSKICRGKSRSQLEMMSAEQFFGTSMMPTIREDSSVYYVKHTNAQDVVTGDIVLIDVGSSLSLVHRVYATYDTYFLSKGDNNVYIDNQQFNYSQIRGVVCMVSYT